jgi:hypothetical protein
MFICTPPPEHILFTTITSFPTTSRANPYLTPSTSHHFLHETVSHNTTFALINLPLPLLTSPFYLNVASSRYKTHKHTFKPRSPRQKCLFLLLVFAYLVFDIIFDISPKATYPPLSINSNLDINLISPSNSTTICRSFPRLFLDIGSKQTYLHIYCSQTRSYTPPPLPSTSTPNPWFSASSFLSATTTHTFVSILLRPQTDCEHLALSNHHTLRSPLFFETASNNLFENTGFET